jgi:hypothetical protein
MIRFWGPLCPDPSLQVLTFRRCRGVRPMEWIRALQDSDRLGVLRASG